MDVERRVPDSAVEPPTPGAQPASDFGAAAHPMQPARSHFARLRRALAEEVQELNVRLLVADLLVRLLPSPGFAHLRTACYRMAGLRIGPRSLVFGRIEFTGTRQLQERLRIGADTFINAHFFVDVNSEVEIGDRVSIGHHVTLITADHELGPAAKRAGPMRSSPVVVGDGCWIGAGCTILPGVRLGKSSIVAAGSLVSGNVPDNKLVGGVPARPLKSLSAEP